MGLHDHRDNQRALFQLANLDPDEAIYDLEYLVRRLPGAFVVRTCRLADRLASLTIEPFVRATPEPRLSPEGEPLRPRATRRRKPTKALAPADPPEPVTVIRVRRGLSFERRQSAIAHELAEWFLATHVLRGEPDPEIEAAADELATQILCPSRALNGVVREILPRDLPAIARVFSLTEAEAVALIAERTGHPIAAVRPESVVYGGDECVFPPEEILRAIADNPLLGRALCPHLRVQAANDERVAFVHPIEWPLDHGLFAE